MTSTPGGPGLWDQATSSRGGRLAVGLAIALACLLALTSAVALASTARGQLASATPAASDDGAKAPGQAPKGGKGNGNDGAGKVAAPGSLESTPGRMGGTLHGEVTRPTSSGTETLLVQTGSVTASTAAEVSVRSTDGFTETYALGPDTQVRGPAKQGGLSAGTRVTVVASQDGKRALLVASKGGSA